MQSRQGTSSSYKVPIKTYKPIASVAAFPAQPLAALPPYGCGVPLAVCERPAGWQYLRRKFIGAMPSSLSLRGGRRPTWQSRSTRPDHRKAIGENATAFPGLPRRFAPRNDTSGSAVVYQRPPTVELPCTGRSLSAATVKFDSDCVRRHSVYIGSAFPRLPRQGGAAVHQRPPAVELHRAGRSPPVKGTPHL